MVSGILITIYNYIVSRRGNIVYIMHKSNRLYMFIVLYTGPLAFINQIFTQQQFP